MIDGKPSRRSILLGGSSTLIVLSGCDQWKTHSSADFPTPISIAMQTWIGYGYCVIAGEEGFFGDMQVDMSVVEDGTALVGGMTGGTTQIIGSTLDQFVLQRSNNLPGRLLAITDDSYGGDGLAVTDTIQTFDQMRGKRIAYTPGPSSEYVLATALKSVGMTLDDITPVTFSDPGGTVAAFVNGKVDAACIFQPYLQQTLSRPGSRLLFTTKQFPDISVGCFILREGLQNGDKIAKRFVEGLKKAQAYAGAHPAEANAILKRFFSVDDKLLGTMRAGARLKTAADNVRYLSSAGGREPAALPLLQNVDAFYRSRKVAGPHMMSASDIDPNAAAAFEAR
ncbi:MAG TPA: ABC transporter substrate-binding protein [Rhizomicrobium sp.]|jgi:NitT/TauT family transport system substrate-binding protein